MGLKSTIYKGLFAVVATASFGAASGVHDGTSGVIREGVSLPYRVGRDLVTLVGEFYTSGAQVVQNVADYPYQTIPWLIVPAGVVGSYYLGRRIFRRRRQPQMGHPQARPHA